MRHETVYVSNLYKEVKLMLSLFDLMSGMQNLSCDVCPEKLNFQIRRFAWDFACTSFSRSVVSIDIFGCVCLPEFFFLQKLLLKQLVLLGRALLSNHSQYIQGQGFFSEKSEIQTLTVKELNVSK